MTIEKKKEWETLENDFFVIKYRQGYEDDARKTLDIAMEVREITLEKYPHELGYKVIVKIYTNPDELKSCTVRSEVGASSGTIHILRPSWEGTWCGYEQLDHPFRRQLNHEYVHVPFYNDLYSKKSGYTDHPPWFNQGVAEYISQNYLPSYKKRVQESVQEGSFMIDELIDESYSWGLYIVEFMYTEYGREKVINLIKSDAPTFTDALKKEIGLSSSKFEDGWRAYLAKKFGAQK